MGYQPFQIAMAGGPMLVGMQLSNDFGWGWWGILASVMVGLALLRLSGVIRDRFPGQALVHLQKNLVMGQRYRPERDRQHVPLILDPDWFE
jgi:hypothetical protein